MQQKLIRQLSPGDQIVAFFILRKKELKTKRDRTTFYLSLELGDSSGRIWGTTWDKPKEIYEKITVGQPLKIKAAIITLNDRLHLSIDKIRPARPEDGIDANLLLPVIAKDRELLFNELLNLCDQITQPGLKALVHKIYSDSELKQKLFDAPGGKLWHHNYRGGLLEHTLSVTRIALSMTAFYPQLRKDLIIAAGLLHDIGKIVEYRVEGFVDFSDRGRLLGHIVIGTQMVKEAADKITDLPESLKTELLHMILSHQGKLEYGSPVVPMTLEAIVLYYADEMDSKANAFQRVIHQYQNSGEKWTGYVKLMERFLYLGEPSE